jgi:hypothetical protein
MSENVVAMLRTEEEAELRYLRAPARTWRGSAGLILSPEVVRFGEEHAKWRRFWVRLALFELKVHRNWVCFWPSKKAKHCVSNGIGRFVPTI